MHAPDAPRARGHAIAKRLFDLVLAAFGGVALSPLLLAIAVWIKLDSPGPVLFRQERVGRFGRPFRIHKFRTMALGAERMGPGLTIGDDARITRAGKALRRAKLDELPQLIDVLVGTMSLVGPRPELARYVALYPAELRAKLLSVRPGITDAASIVFRDESALLAAAVDPERAYAEVVLPAKLRLAAAYVDSASLANDLSLIARTVAMLLRGR